MVDVSVLFRYRDLVAPTLNRHREMIERGGRGGYCWWGWWKRPSEDARTDIWEHLKRQVNRSGREPVALFNSGDGKVHLAYIADVIPPTDIAASRPPALSQQNLRRSPSITEKAFLAALGLRS